MKIRLSLDIDGTICDCFSKWQSLAYKEGVQEPFDHEYNGIYKVRCSDGEIFANKLFGEYRDQWVLESKPFPDVADFIESINYNDHITWWVVTSRGEDTKDLTKQWLENNNIDGYEDLLFLQDKTKAPVNTLVDDKPSHILDFQKKARLGYLLTRSYNLNATVARRADNLQQIYSNLLQFI